ncbi:MAG: excinuclease ABC subunit UvrC [Chloroflexi bacterium]|nr:excinuclease ABC subunit UvrC [Chloroflexota bacterium]MBI3734388.1 excinuclease ABC subunit UvrC [Chloroflexota bacterium]
MNESVPPSIQDQLDALPTKPGCYLMKDSQGAVIYVGKAINLRSRVRSYWHKSSAYTSPKTGQLSAQVARIEFIVTGSELEALVLENNLIKRYRPRYNVRLKDDKRYPYIKVTWQEPFPKVFMTRRMERDGARYYGPFTAAWAVYETLNTLRRVFPYLTCDREINGRDPRACMYYDIKLCNAPCIGAVRRDEYRAVIQQLSDFLDGRSDEIVTDIRARMEQAAERLEFERAAALRNQLTALQKISEKQAIVSTRLADQDVVAFARDDPSTGSGQACMQVFFIRNGKLIGREYFVLEGTAGKDSQEVLSSFMTQFYDEAAYVPPEILLPEAIDESKIIESWLKDRRGDKVEIHVPHHGHKRDLVEMAINNAVETLTSLRAQWLKIESQNVTALTELQETLGLPNPPTRIEGYDISNTQGTAIVGAMVVFDKGLPRKSDYRKFKIQTVSGEPDDFASLQEMLRRRFKRYAGDHRPNTVPEPLVKDIGKKPDASFAVLPDLIMIDGGKGQLSSAVEVMQEFALDHIPIISLAKQAEEIFRPGQLSSIRLPRDAHALQLLQRVRDEAHRFGLTFHRSLREKRSLASQLDEIKGIGPKRRQALLKTFGSVEAIRNASVEEIERVDGMSKAAARLVKAGL